MEQKMILTAMIDPITKNWIDDNPFNAGEDFMCHFYHMVYRMPENKSVLRWSPIEIQYLRRALFRILKVTGWTPMHSFIIRETSDYGVKTIGNLLKGID
jgi:hypothetical protein